MDRKKIYLFLCVLGVVLPYSQIVPWISQNGWNAASFFRLLFANGVSGACVLDVLVTSAIVVVFIVVEGETLGDAPHLAAPRGSTGAGRSFCSADVSLSARTRIRRSRIGGGTALKQFRMKSARKYERSSNYLGVAPA